VISVTGGSDFCHRVRFRLRVILRLRVNSQGTARDVRCRAIRISRVAAVRQTGDPCSVISCGTKFFLRRKLTQ